MDNSNSGVDSSSRRVVDGEGTESAIYLSDDVLAVRPINDNTAASFVVQAKDGTPLFTVDSTNSAVKSISEHVNTQYQRFSIYRAIASAGYHYSMHLGGSTSQRAGADLGNSADPSTTYDLSGDSGYPELAPLTYWYVTDNIEIDRVSVLTSGYGTGTGTDIHFHLMSYDMSASAGSLGDLSNGTVLFNSSADIEDIVETAIHRQILSSVSTSVTAGKIIVATFEESNSAGANAQANMTVKYHLT